MDEDGTNNSVQTIPFAGFAFTRASLMTLVVGITATAVLVGVLASSGAPASVSAAAFMFYAMWSVGASYQVYCLQIGSCNIFAWFVAAVYTINAVGTAALLLTRTFG